MCQLPAPQKPPSRRGLPLPLLPHCSSSSERLLFSRSRPRRLSSPAMPEPSLHRSACFHHLIFPTGAFCRVYQFPPPSSPASACHLLGRASRAGVGGWGWGWVGEVGGCGARAEPHGFAQWRWHLRSSGGIHLGRLFFFFNPEVLNLKLHVFPGHSYFVCFSRSIFGKSLPWRSSQSRRNRR